MNNISLLSDQKKKYLKKICSIPNEGRPGREPGYDENNCQEKGKRRGRDERSEHGTMLV